MNLLKRPNFKNFGFSFLAPKGSKIFPLFVKLVANLVEISSLLVEIVKETEVFESQKKIRRVNEFKLNVDIISRNILSELNRTFITPLDREDIHDLIIMLQGVSDDICAATKRIHGYRIYSFPEEFVMIGTLIHTTILEIYHVLENVHSSRDFKNHSSSYKIIGEMESKADDIYHDYLVMLFAGEHDTIDLIKKRDVMVNLEKAIDKCNDISKIFSSLMIKMS